MLPGLTEAQAASLRRRGLTRKKLEQLLARARASRREDPVIAALPAAARAELEFAPEESMSLATAERLAERLRDTLRWPKSRVLLVGSARRGKPVVKDLDLLLVAAPSPAAPPGPSESLAALSFRPSTASSRRPRLLTSYSSGARRRSAIVRHHGKNYRVDFFFARESEKPYALFHHTGSSRYNIRIRAHAKARGWRLNQYGLYDRATGRRVRGTSRLRTEEDLARFLGVSYRLPGDRTV